MLTPKRIMQTELGPAGNCQSACLAMMLGCELSEVPNFAKTGDRKSTEDEFRGQLVAWLAKRGLHILTFKKWEGAPFPPEHGFWIVGGVSPRGYMHGVIYKDGELWHDPHPEGGGLVEPLDIDLILPLGFRPMLENAEHKM
jgi:hypothetical protein